MSNEHRKRVRMNLAREAATTSRGFSGEPVVTMAPRRAWVEFPAIKRSYAFRRDKKGRLYFVFEESLNPHVSGIKNARNIVKEHYQKRAD